MLPFSLAEIRLWKTGSRVYHMLKWFKWGSMLLGMWDQVSPGCHGVLMLQAWRWCQYVRQFSAPSESALRRQVLCAICWWQIYKVPVKNAMCNFVSLAQNKFEMAHGLWSVLKFRDAVERSTTIFLQDNIMNVHRPQHIQSSTVANSQEWRHDIFQSLPQHYISVANDLELNNRHSIWSPTTDIQKFWLGSLITILGKETSLWLATISRPGSKFCQCDYWHIPLILTWPPQICRSWGRPNNT